MAYDEGLADDLRARLSGVDGVTERRMFGGLAFLLHGNLAVAASGAGGLMVRCDPAEADAHVAAPHVSRMVMRGRAMDGWLRVAPDAVQDDAELDRWVRVGVERARRLPPKG